MAVAAASSVDDDLMERIKVLWPLVQRVEAETQTTETIEDDLTNVALQDSYLRLHESSRAAVEQCRADDLAFLLSVDNELRSISRKTSALLRLVAADEKRARSHLVERESDVRSYMARMLCHEHQIRLQKTEIVGVLETRRGLEREMHALRHKS